MCAEIYHTLKQLLKEQGYSTSVGDEALCAGFKGFR